MTKQHYVLLNASQRETLDRLIRRRSTQPLTRRHARILLLCDTTTGGGNRTDVQVAQVVHCSWRQVARVRSTFARLGLAAAIGRKQRVGNTPRLLDPVQEARVIELVLSPTPTGHSRWTLRTLGDEVVARGIVPSISRETVRQTLKRGAVLRT